MKKKWLYFNISILILLFSCKNNIEKKSTITSDEVIVEINGKVENRNEIIFGENIELIFNNIRGLNKIDGKTYPNMSVYVKNNDDTLYNTKPAEELKSGTNSSPLNLTAYIKAVLPEGANYNLIVKISDNKGEGELEHSFPFSIKKNQLLKIDNNGLEYSNIILFDDTRNQHITTNEVNRENSLFLIFKGLEGFELIDKKYFPICSFKLINKKGEVVSSNINILDEYEESGISPKEIDKIIRPKIPFEKAKSKNNPHSLIINVRDKNSNNNLTVTTQLNIK